MPNALSAFESRNQCIGCFQPGPAIELGRIPHGIDPIRWPLHRSHAADVDGLMRLEHKHVSFRLTDTRCLLQISYEIGR